MAQNDQAVFVIDFCVLRNAFVQRLRVLAPELEDGCAYRLHGSVISSKRVAVFPLETLQRVDKQEFVSL